MVKLLHKHEYPTFAETSFIIIEVEVCRTNKNVIKLLNLKNYLQLVVYP